MLRVSALNAGYGSLQVLWDVHLEVGSGELVALVGPNGAGKTTLLNLISGRYRPDGGQIVFNGQVLQRFDPVSMFRMGIGRSFQLTNIFRGLTVVENVAAALLARSARWDWLRYWWEHRQMMEEAMAILEKVGLASKAGMLASALSHGEQRHLEIALVLAGRPKLLLLDEPTAGMVSAEAARTMELVRALVEKDRVTVVFTEHDMRVVFSMAHRVTVMHQGRVIAEGTPSEIRQDERVRKAYLGSELNA